MVSRTAADARSERTVKRSQKTSTNYKGSDMMIEPKNDGRGRMQYDLPPGTQQLFIRKEEVMQFFNLVEREPPGFGMGKTALFTEFAEAYRKDAGNPDRSLDLISGPASSAFFAKVAREFLQAKCEPQERFTGKHPALGMPYNVDYVTRVEDPQDVLRIGAVPELEANVEMVDDELTDELLDSRAGRMWIALSARFNQYESAFGHHRLTIPARIDCVRRAMESQEI